MNSPELRPDQMRAVEELRAALAVHQSVLLQAATGFGKTYLASYIAAGSRRKRKRTIFAVHRRELARQTARTFDRFGIEYGFIAAGWPSNPFALVQIASVDTLRRRPHLMGCDLFVPDEAHLWTGETRLEVINTVRQAGAHIVPLTATPEAPDGRPMRLIADHMVCGPSVAWLIERGHLSKYIPYAAARPDLTKVGMRGGDYSVPGLAANLDRPALIGDAVTTYRKYAMGLRTVGYCFSRDHGKHMRDVFRHEGIPSGYIDGDTSDDERRETIWKFAKRDIWTLFNVALIREGFDLSSQVDMDVPIEAVGLYAPTTSLPLARQEMGRALRPKELAAPILDHAGIIVNRDGTLNHGFPDDEREWSLDGKSKAAGGGEKAIPVCVCMNCLASFRPRPACPYCGHVRDVEGREIEIREGELHELDIEKVRLADIERRRKEEFEKKELRRREQAARTPDKLVEFARDQGYKLPGWVIAKLKGRGDWKGDATLREVYKAMKNA